MTERTSNIIIGLPEVVEEKNEMPTRERGGKILKHDSWMR